VDHLVLLLEILLLFKVLQVLGLQLQRSYKMYQLILNPRTGELMDGILRVADDAFIPNDPENTDWQAYQEWLAAGNVPLPPEGN
jgi:hypothetical protein